MDSIYTSKYGHTSPTDGAAHARMCAKVSLSESTFTRPSNRKSPLHGLPFKHSYYSK